MSRTASSAMPPPRACQRAAGPAARARRARMWRDHANRTIAEQNPPVHASNTSLSSRRMPMDVPASVWAQLPRGWPMSGLCVLVTPVSCNRMRVHRPQVGGTARNSPQPDPCTARALRYAKSLCASLIECAPPASPARAAHTYPPQWAIANSPRTGLRRTPHSQRRRPHRSRGRLRPVRTAAPGTVSSDVRRTLRPQQQRKGLCSRGAIATPSHRPT